MKGHNSSPHRISLRFPQQCLGESHYTRGGSPAYPEVPLGTLGGEDPTARFTDLTYGTVRNSMDFHGFGPISGPDLGRF